MKQTLTTSQAAHLLMRDDNANWSRAGAFALIEHLEEYEEGCGVEIEFDAVAIRCDWCEYQSIFDAAEDFGWEWEGDEDADKDEKERAALDWLRERTQVVEFDGGVIVQRY